MAGLKPVFCESINKGRRVGWGRGGVFYLGGLGLVSKITFVEGEYKESLYLFSFLIVGCRKGKRILIERKQSLFLFSFFVVGCRDSSDTLC